MSGVEIVHEKRTLFTSEAYMLGKYFPFASSVLNNDCTSVDRNVYSWSEQSYLERSRNLGIAYLNAKRGMKCSFYVWSRVVDIL